MDSIRGLHLSYSFALPKGHRNSCDAAFGPISKTIHEKLTRFVCLRLARGMRNIVFSRLVTFARASVARLRIRVAARFSCRVTLARTSAARLQGCRHFDCFDRMFHRTNLPSSQWLKRPARLDDIACGLEQTGMFSRSVKAMPFPVDSKIHLNPWFQIVIKRQRFDAGSCHQASADICSGSVSSAIIR